jgi:hypothetical protein
MKNDKPIGFSGLSLIFLVYRPIFLGFVSFKKIKSNQSVFGDLTKLVGFVNFHKNRSVFVEI